MRRRVKRRQFDAGGDQTSCRRSRDAAKNMYATRRATIGHFLHHSGHGPCDDGTRSCRLHGPVHEDTFEIQNVFFFKIFGTLNHIHCVGKILGIPVRALYKWSSSQSV